jgi:hypothetical protein
VDAFYKSRVTRRHEYSLSSPTNAVEMDKAVSWARSDYQSANPNRTLYDNTITIQSWDDKIIIYWEEEVPDA